MDIQLAKSQFQLRFEQINDIHLIDALNAMIDFALQKDKNSFHISLDQYNKEIEMADAEMDEGHFFSHQQALDEMQTWAKK